MDRDPVSRRKHANGWMTVLALGLLTAGSLACLYVLIGLPAQAQVVSGPTPQTLPSAPPPAPHPFRRQPPMIAAPAADAVQASGQSAVSAPAYPDRVADELRAEITAVREQLRRSQDYLREAVQAQHRTRNASALFLAVFTVIAALIVLQVYLQARAWDGEQSRAVAEVEEIATQLKVLRDARNEARSALPHYYKRWASSP